MNVTVNGNATTVADGATLADVVASVTDALRGVAVAVDREIVPRSQWGSRALKSGDRLEILVAAAGG
jgi:sulfur carrier protein